MQKAYRITVQVPRQHVENLKSSILKVDSLTIGNYQYVFWTSAVGEEQFQPKEGAIPTLGQIGRLQKEPSVQLVFTLPRNDELLNQILEQGIKPAHPWEVPVVFVDECWIPLENDF